MAKKTLAARLELAETREHVEARKRFYVQLKTDWPTIVAELDARIAKAVQDKAMAEEKYANADAIIAECDAQLFRLESKQAAARVSPKAEKRADRAKKLGEKIMSLIDGLDGDDLEAVLERLLANGKGQ